MKSRDPYAHIAQRFKRETARHEITIILDQGLHRHLRFAEPGQSAYWFELITVPGALIFQGDGESFVFRRLRDMFEFFRSNPDRRTMRISPDYWAEKLTNGRASVKTYSRERFEQRVMEDLAAEFDLGDSLRTLVKTVRREILRSDDADYEETARRLLEEFEFWADPEDQYKPGRKPDFKFTDTWEWDLRDYDWWFLWACHAIVWGIARYDAARKLATADITAALTALTTSGGETAESIAVVKEGILALAEQ